MQPLLKQFSFAGSCAAFLLLTLVWLVPANAQAKKKQDKKEKAIAVIRGKIAYDKAREKSWDGNRLVVPYSEIEAKLRQKVVLPLAPYPAEAKNWDRAQIIKWELEFVKTKAGKAYLENEKRILEEAYAFDIRFETDGSFVVYDVPPGVYGIQGRVDKEIGGTKYGFEIFGQVEVLKDVDEIVLKPMRVEVTPIMASKQKAPPVGVKTFDGKRVLNLKTFEDKILFINFWSIASPTAAIEQQMVQKMYSDLKEKHPIKLLSVSVDQDPKKVIEYLRKNKIGVPAKDGKVKPIGSFGFTNGGEHRTLFDYGVRSFPSFWLVGPDGNIMMSQYEVAAAMRLKPDMTTIVADRIEGKDAPTPAAEKPTGAKKTDGANASKIGSGLDFEMKSLAGDVVDLSKYQGKVVMVVNVASKCGYTKHYKQLQEMHEKYAGKGLAILGVPCNQFGGQEPGSNEEIASFCESKFGVEFDMFAKSDVNGNDQSELYKYLTSLDLKPVGKGPVKWNFEKIILDKSGTPVARFGTRESPDSEAIVNVIETALAK